jgi:hypothetical protein
MNTISFTQKILVCLLAGLVSGAAFLRIGKRFLTRFVPLELIIGAAVLILVMALVFAVMWHIRAKSAKINNDLTKTFWVAVIRYSIALDLAMFGFQKIFHLQFTTPRGMLDEPFSSFSGEWLTFTYFGQSYPFVVVIGILQIAGSFLLLFTRTRLLALMIILPVLLNIVLIDFFYSLAPGVLAHAIFILLSAIYLLLLDYDRLLLFFVKHDNMQSSFSAGKSLKYVGRISILLLPILLIAINESPDKHPELNGKYSVKSMTIDGTPMMATSCADSLLTLVYLDRANECVFEFNHQKRRLYGTYEMPATDQIIVSWHFPRGKDKFIGTIHRVNNKLELSGTIAGDSLSVALEQE